MNIFQQPQQKETAKLINAIWGAVSSSLWFNKTFSKKETDQYKELICEHFLNGKDSKRNFKELVERICLAKRYVARKRGRYISKPQDYLNIHYPLGLTGTAAWLQQVNVVRKEVPEYNKGITTLAKALLSFIEIQALQLSIVAAKTLQNKISSISSRYTTTLLFTFNTVYNAKRNRKAGHVCCEGVYKKELRTLYGIPGVHFQTLAQSRARIK